jgi:hypothetical protein|tara:strand:- start:527 stop:766 length:240 start_codon:yes stop_codon:yes gene_type:complete
MAGKKKSKGKVVGFTGKHKLDKYLTKDQIKQLDPFGVDLLLQIKEGADKGKKRFLGGYTVTNKFSDIMLPEKKRTTRIT